MAPKSKKPKPPKDDDGPGPDGAPGSESPEGGKKKKKKKDKEKDKPPSEPAPVEGADEAMPEPDDLVPGDEGLPEPGLADLPPLPADYRPPVSRVAEHLRHHSPTRADPSRPHELKVDPRTELEILSVPEEYREEFKELMGDQGDDSQVLLHVFEKVRRAVDKPVGAPPVPMILMLTDQTLFLCKPNGKVQRCTQIDKFQGVAISQDGSNEIAFRGPPDEFDIVIEPEASATKSARDVRNDIIMAFTTVYKRLTNGRLPKYEKPLQIDKHEYHLSPPEDFRLVCVPQRTKGHLRKALENFESQQKEALQWVEDVQQELEKEYGKELEQRDTYIQNLVARLEEAEQAQDEQRRDIIRLREYAGLDPNEDGPRGKVILNEEGMPVDAETGEPREALTDKLGNIILGQDGQPIPVDAEGRPLDPKDMRIQDLERTLTTLKEATERRVQEDRELRFAGNFFQRDLVHEIPQVPVRPRGGSLHYQGLVEVLQNQVDLKNEELEHLREQVLEIDELRTALRQKDATIRALQLQASSSGGVQVDDRDDLPAYAGSPADSVGTGGPPAYYSGVHRSPIGGGYGGRGSVDSHPGYGGGFHVDGAPHGGTDPGGLHSSRLADLPPPDALYAAAPQVPQTRIVRRKKPGGGGGRQRNLAPFQPEPYQRKLPESPDLLTVDPRTGLPLVGVPQENRQEFSDLADCVLHFFERVKKFGKRGRTKEEQRVLCITDRDLYQCSLDGLINRCSYVTDVEEILTDDTNAIGFKMSQDAKDYDMLYELGSRKEQQEVVHIVRTLQEAMGERVAPVSHLSQPIDQHQLRLQKPQNWQYTSHSVRTKLALYNDLRKLEQEEERAHDRAQRQRAAQWEQHQRAAAAGDEEDEYEEVEEIVNPGYDPHDQSYTHQVADAYTQKALESLRQYLQQEFAAKKEEEYQRLRARIRELEEENEEHADQNRELKMQWKLHRCSREQPPPNIPSKLSEGMYWIPTEPLVIECSTEVLHVQFWDNILITSHPNGFLNVWDVNTAELVRTLKDHTARVVAFQYDGVELVSGSYDSTIRRWNVTDGSCLNWVQAHRGQVTCLQFDRHILVSGATDSTIQVWQMDIELRNLKTLRGHKSGVQCLHFENNTLVSAEWGWIFVWDMHRGVVSKALRDDQGGITSVDYRDGYLLTGGQGGVLTMWDVDTNDFDTLEGHTDDITHIQLEGRYAVTSSADCTIRMWNLQEFKALGVFNNSYPHECKSFQFVANRFVAAEKKTVKVWTK